MRLRHGEFFGSGDSRRRVDGFRLSRLRPTVPERELSRHTHDDAHFVMLLEGQYLTAASGGHAECVPGTLIYNPPGTTHRDRFRSSDGEFFTLSLPDSIKTDFANYADGGARQMDRRTQAFALAMANECLQWRLDSPELVRALVLELMDRTTAKRASDTCGVPGWLSAARDWLHDHQDRAPRIAALAEACGVHPVYLARMFRRHFGCSPVEYSRRLRMSRATHWLREGDASIAEIALRCGFADQSHFHRHFLRVHGHSPSAFRRAG